MLKPLKLMVLSNWWFNIVEVNIVNIGRPPTFVCCLSLVSSARLHLSPSLFHNCLWRHTSKHLWYHHSRSAEVFLRFVTPQDLDISLFPSFETKTKQPPRELQKSDEKTLAPLTTKSDFLVDTCSLVVGERIFGSKITKSEKSFGN